MGSQCCSQKDVECASPNSSNTKRNLININTDLRETLFNSQQFSCTTPTSILPPETLKMLLGIHIPYSPIPTPTGSCRITFDSATITPITPIDEAPNGVQEPEEFDDIMSVALDVMSPDTPSRKHMIRRNRCSADTIDTINSEVIENDIYDSDASDNYEEGERTLIATQHERKRSNLIQAKTSDTWDARDMDDLAHEMRNQLVLLQRNSLSACAVYSGNLQKDEDTADESESESESELEDMSPTPQTVTYNVHAIVSENMRLMEEYRDKKEENMQKNNIIKKQQQQIEDLQRMVRSLIERK